MVKLPPPLNRTADAIYRLYEKRREDWRRPHLGASVLGDENCLRHLWYSFRWAMEKRFEGRLLRLFETGHNEELRIILNLDAIGVTIDSAQERVSFFGGHVGGSNDGVARGVLEAPKTPHVLECKTMNEKRFKGLQKVGCREAQPGHFTQMQIYMKGLKLTRALYFVVHKDTDYIYTERIKFSSKHATAMLNKAERVVFAASPPAKINEDPAWFECKFCDHRPICHFPKTHLLERNCRTCTSSTPMPDGSWRCEFHGMQLSVEEQRSGCLAHLFNPGLLEPWELIDGSDVHRWARYRLRGGSHMLDSVMKLVSCEG